VKESRRIYIYISRKAGREVVKTYLINNLKPCDYDWCKLKSRMNQADLLGVYQTLKVIYQAVTSKHEAFNFLPRKRKNMEANNSQHQINFLSETNMAQANQVPTKNK